MVCFTDVDLRGVKDVPGEETKAGASFCRRRVGMGAPVFTRSEGTELP